jgi:hypothetical protein
MCNCSSNISNCNCNDCSVITIPSIIGPQGPQGPQGDPGVNGTNGTNGSNGLDAGNVIDTVTTFASGPVEGTERTYSPGVLVSSTTEITKAEDRLKIRAVFTLDDTAIAANGVLAVYINSSVAIAGSSKIVEFDGTIPNNKFFYLEFYFDRVTINSFNAVGTAKFADSLSEVGSGLYPLSDGNYIINRTGVATGTNLSANFYIFLGSENLGYINPSYFTVEYILRKS